MLPDTVIVKRTLKRIVLYLNDLRRVWKMRSILVLWLALALTGCVLAPQTISLNEQVELQGEITEQRNALVRVLDNRPDTSDDQLGHRGGRAPDLSPVLSDKPLSVVLTNRMRDSLRSLGFGSESDLQPIRVQLEVKTFAYRCNESRSEEHTSELQSRPHLVCRL